MDYELSFDISEEELKKLKKILTADGVRHYLLQTSADEQLDVIEYQEYQKIEKENEYLKKQLEKKYEKVGTLTGEILYEENTRLTNEITVIKTENQELKKQLKEKENHQNQFIEWLENEKKEQFIQHRTCHQSYQLFIEKISETETMILEKYKEIIGDNNGN